MIDDRMNSQRIPDLFCDMEIVSDCSYFGKFLVFSEYWLFLCEASKYALVERKIV